MKKMERKIFAMYKRFGTCGAMRCKDCSHLIKVRPTDRHFYKCELYGNTGGESTDWRLSYGACGMFDMEVDMQRWEPVIEQLKHAPKVDVPLHGQMDIGSFLSESHG